MKLLLRNVRLVKPEEGATDRATSDISIRGGRIADVAPAGLMAADGARAIDAGGRFAMPGMINCHCHLAGVFLPAVPTTSQLIRSLRWIPKQIDLNLRTELASGVTTVRDLMAPLRIIKYLRSRAQDPKSAYPRILCSGPMLTVPGGYPPHVPPDRRVGRALMGPLRVELRSAGDAGRWVDRLAREGVDWIKIGFSSRGYDDAGTPLPAMSKALFEAVVSRAHDRGLPVAVHHTWLADLHRLVELPFDTLEHLPLGGDIGEELANRIAKRELPVTTNLESFAFLDRLPEYLSEVENGRAPLLPAPRRAMAGMFRGLTAGKSPGQIFGLDALRGGADQMAANLQRLVASGVLVGAATDAGTHVFFGSLPVELRHMARAGMAPAAVLRAATSDAARLLGRSDLGGIAPGLRADLVLCDDDPLANLERLGDPALVVRDGVAIAGGLAR